MKTILITMLVLIVVASIVCLPIGFIWSINTLFPLLCIQYKFSTWAAALFILGIFAGGKISYKQ